jgi:protein-tyrosine phosphatase
MDEIRRIAGKHYDPTKTSLLLDELGHTGKDVPDPWYGPEPGYHEVYKLLNEVCDAIIKNHRSSKATTSKQTVNG